MQYFFIVILCIVVGSFLPIQAGVNSKLGSMTAGPHLAAMISFMVGTIVLLMSYILAGNHLPKLQVLGKLPWWSWSGGIMGAFVVLTTIIVVPKIGASMMVVLFLLGQLTISIAMDHFCWLDVPYQPVSVGRICGILLVLAGVVLVRKY